MQHVLLASAAPFACAFRIDSFCSVNYSTFRSGRRGVYRRFVSPRPLSPILSFPRFRLLTCLTLPLHILSTLLRCRQRDLSIQGRPHWFGSTRGQKMERGGRKTPPSDTPTHNRHTTTSIIIIIIGIPLIVSSVSTPTSVIHHPSIVYSFCPPRPPLFFFFLAFENS